MFNRIVVPLDGSDVAEFALPPAVELAKRFDADLHLIRITDMSHLRGAVMYSYMGDSRVMAENVATEMELAREYLQENARVLADEGLRVTTELETGFAATELVRAMKPGDLFVIASHGRSGIDRWYLGSVAEQVMRRATVPVTVVRGSQLTSHGKRFAHSAISCK